MTSRSTRTTRRPRDSRTRDRLLEAQQLEAEALADVCAAQEDLNKACLKRDTALAAASARVDEAQGAVELAQTALVRVSGLDRAALLLAIDATTLRKVANSKNGPRRAE
jgi:hypothetical protein